VKGKRENGKIGKAKEEKIGIREMGNGEMQREVKPPPPGKNSGYGFAYF